MTTDQPQQTRTHENETGSLPVGAALRVKREQLGWSLADVAAWLRIKLSYLEALEGGQVSKLPGNAYALGFLRAYSGVLGLDAEDMSRRFRHETKEINRRPELAFPSPVPERGVPAGAVVLLGVLLVVGTYVGWYELTAHERSQPHVVPPVPPSLLPYAGPGAASAPSPQVATVMPGPGQTPSPLPPAPAVATPTSAAPETANQPPAAIAGRPVATETGPAEPPASSSTGTAAPLPITTSAAPAAPPAGTPLPATASSVPLPAATPAPAPAGQITLAALASCWVQVRQVDGKVLVDRVLQPGDRWTVPADAGAVTLSTGNAGGLTLIADGITTPPLGRNGTVRRAIPLSLSSIHDGSIAAAGIAAGPVQPAAVAAGSSPTPPAAASLPASDPGLSRSAAHLASPSTRTRVLPPSPGGETADSLNARQLQRPAPH